MSLCKGICRNKNKKCNNKHKDGSSYCGTHTSQPLGKQFQTNIDYSEEIMKYIYMKYKK